MFNDNATVMCLYSIIVLHVCTLIYILSIIIAIVTLLLLLLLFCYYYFAVVFRRNKDVYINKLVKNALLPRV